MIVQAEHKTQAKVLQADPTQIHISPCHMTHESRCHLNQGRVRYSQHTSVTVIHRITCSNPNHVGFKVSRPFPVSCPQKREVNTVLADVIKHMTPDRAFEDAYPQVGSSLAERTTGSALETKAFSLLVASAPR